MSKPQQEPQIYGSRPFNQSCRIKFESPKVDSGQILGL